MIHLVNTERVLDNISCTFLSSVTSWITYYQVQWADVLKCILCRQIICPPFSNTGYIARHYAQFFLMDEPALQQKQYLVQEYYVNMAVTPDELQ